MRGVVLCTWKTAATAPYRHDYCTRPRSVQIAGAAGTELKLGANTNFGLNQLKKVWGAYSIDTGTDEGRGMNLQGFRKFMMNEFEVRTPLYQGSVQGKSSPAGVTVWGCGCPGPTGHDASGEPGVCPVRRRR